MFLIDTNNAHWQHHTGEAHTNEATGEQMRGPESEQESNKRTRGRAGVHMCGSAAATVATNATVLAAAVAPTKQEGWQVYAQWQQQGGDDTNKGRDDKNEGGMM